MMLNLVIINQAVVVLATVVVDRDRHRCRRRRRRGRRRRGRRCGRRQTKKRCRAKIEFVLTRFNFFKRHLLYSTLALNTCGC